MGILEACSPTLVVLIFGWDTWAKGDQTEGGMIKRHIIRTETIAGVADTFQGRSVISKGIGGMMLVPDHIIACLLVQDAPLTTLQTPFLQSNLAPCNLGILHPFPYNIHQLSDKVNFP